MTLNDGVEWKQSMVCVPFNVQTITYYTHCAYYTIQNMCNTSLFMMHLVLVEQILVFYFSTNATVPQNVTSKSITKYTN